jgi:peptide/nickel transport system ATP-binding protein/oligopeptide transport system ATP-binding protein
MRCEGQSGSVLVCVQSLGKVYVQRRVFAHTEYAVRALEDVNISLSRGKTVALVGESGAGKSTLARCIALLETPSCGEICFEGMNVTNFGDKELFPLRRKIQLVFQDATSALNPRMTAAEIIAEPLAIHREGTAAEQREKALRLMEQVGLAPAWGDKRPLEFSGGQRQRLAIARALALDPCLLIFDEALSNLDARNQDLILQLLADLQTARSLTYLHVCHELNLVERFADEVAVMRNGKIVECQPTPELFARPQHPYTRELLAAMPSVESICRDRLAGARL